jgi:hypothetical protein
MGADRQRNHADESGGHGDRAAGNAKLRYFHRGSFLSSLKARAPDSRANDVSGLRDWAFV